MLEFGIKITYMDRWDWPDTQERWYKSLEERNKEYDKWYKEDYLQRDRKWGSKVPDEYTQYEKIHRVVLVSNRIK